MLGLLFLIPVLAAVVVIGLYRQTGKRDILKLDVVQFFYAFVIVPILFVWSKSFLFLILRTELTISLTPAEMFAIDTFYSTMFLFVYGFVVMHSLTKTFNLKMAQDPLYDLFHHSEYIHLWLSHLVIYLGMMTLLAIIGVANAIIPLPDGILLTKAWFYGIVMSGIVAGGATYLGAWLSNPHQVKTGRWTFMRSVKLMIGLLFMVLATISFAIDISFEVTHVLYWAVMAYFSTMAVLGMLTYRSVTARGWVERVSDWFKHAEWEFRAQLKK